MVLRVLGVSAAIAAGLFVADMAAPDLKMGSLGLTSAAQAKGDDRGRDDSFWRSSSRRCSLGSGESWMSIDQVAAKARQHGYGDIREIEKDDGCWEVYARDKNGARVELYLHPASGEIVKIERD